MIIKFSNVPFVNLSRLLAFAVSEKNLFIARRPIIAGGPKEPKTEPVVILKDSNSIGRGEYEITLEILEQHWVQYSPEEEAEITDRTKYNASCGYKKVLLPRRIISGVFDILGLFPEA